MPAAILASLLAGPAFAAPEPYGQGFDGWQLTQSDEAGKINCRAFFGIHILAMQTDGGVYASTSADGLPKFYEEEGNINIGGKDDLVQIRSEGQGRRLLVGVNGTMDRAMLVSIVKARGYSWKGGPRGGRTFSGTVKFNNSIDRAYRELRNCVMANGGK